jgi:FeS assembly SUF system regulator
MLRTSLDGQENPLLLRMSRITDYGIVLLTQLASSAGDEVHNARELAARTGLPLPVVSKILKALTREGFLHSQRGARGGYALARPATEISVAAVIDALEGPIALTDCGTHPGACERESRCAVRAPWQQINRAVRRTLEGVRLSQLMPPSSLLPNPPFGGGTDAAPTPPAE